MIFARTSRSEASSGVLVAGGESSHSVSPSTCSSRMPAPHSWRSRPPFGFGDARLQHRVRAADGRMAGERQLGARREDAQPVVGRGRARRQDERGFGEIGPGGDSLHVLRCQILRFQDNRNRIAAERHPREDVDLLERCDGPHARRQASSKRRPRAAARRSSPDRPCRGCRGSSTSSARPGRTPRPPWRCRSRTSARCRGPARARR